MRPCITPTCERLTRGTRCTACEAQYQRQRGTPTQRGYGPDYRKRRLEAISAEPWCHRVGGCRYPEDAGTLRNPLTADHIVPVKYGGRDGPLTVLCKRDNASRGARLQ
jgi:5-methylcytosine-specific restriction endonuclease McrA